MLAERVPPRPKRDAASQSDEQTPSALGCGVLVLTLRLTAPARGVLCTVVRALQDGTPSIHVDPSAVDQGRITIVPTALSPEHVSPIAGRLRELLGLGLESEEINAP